MVAGGGRQLADEPHRPASTWRCFEATSPDTMLGGLEIGGPQTIAFHPVLPIGVAQEANYDLLAF